MKTETFHHATITITHGVQLSNGPVDIKAIKTKTTAGYEGIKVELPNSGSINFDTSTHGPRYIEIARALRDVLSEIIDKEVELPR